MPKLTHTKQLLLGNRHLGVAVLLYARLADKVSRILFHSGRVMAVDVDVFQRHCSVVFLFMLRIVAMVLQSYQPSFAICARFVRMAGTAIDTSWLEAISIHNLARALGVSK